MFSLFIDYCRWHYTHAVRKIFSLTKEFVRFFFNLFSVGLFLKSLFSPIFSIPVDDVETPDVSSMIATFLGSVVLRIVGAILRTGLILLGLFFSILTIIFFCSVFILWLLMPVVFVTVTYFAISNIFLLL